MFLDVNKIVLNHDKNTDKVQGGSCVDAATMSSVLFKTTKHC